MYRHQYYNLYMYVYKPMYMHNNDHLLCETTYTGPDSPGVQERYSDLVDLLLCLLDHWMLVPGPHSILY